MNEYMFLLLLQERGAHGMQQKPPTRAQMGMCTLAVSHWHFTTFHHIQVTGTMVLWVDVHRLLIYGQA